MAISILMPALSPTMTEGVLSRWLVKEGDEVKSGDVVAEIETDKAVMEVESVDEGVVGRLCVEAGSEGVAVNSVIAVLIEEGEGEEAIEALVKEAGGGGKEREREEKVVEEKKPEMVKSGAVKPDVAKSKTAKSGTAKSGGEEVARGGRVKISPLARRLAGEHDLDTGKIEGSGPRGRIIKRDIERVVAEGGTGKVQAAGSVGGARVGLGDREDPLFPNSVMVAHSNMRKVIASRLTESKQTIPHFYLSMDVKIDNLMSWRMKMNELGGGRYKISVNDIVVKAVAHALMKEEKANAGWTDDGIRYFESADVAVAVAIEGGLVTPVVRDAQNLGLVRLSETVKDLALRAREGKLLPEEYQGGTFSVSNLGMFGIDQFQAVINPPQACILAVGRGREVVVFRGEEVVKESVINLTLSVDHRVVDGAIAASYLSALRDFLEDPAMMLL